MRRAAAAPRIPTSARRGPPQTLSARFVSDLGRRLADKLGDTPSADDPGVHPGKPVGVFAVPVKEDRHGEGFANLLELALVSAVDEDTFGPLALGALCRLGPVDLDEERDSVSLGDGLAETAGPGPSSQFW